MEFDKNNNVEDQAMETRIWDITYGFAGSLVLKCAIELEIADIIHKHGEPISLSELASQLPVNKPTDLSRLYRVMRYLIHMKLFTKEINDLGEVKYGLAPSAGKFLVRSSDDKSMATLILGAHQEAFMAPWHHLKESLSHDSSQSGTIFEKALGKSIWEYMGDNQEMNKLFNECMASDSRRMVAALISDCKNVFEGLTTLVDVGGGPGTAAKAISKAFPHIKCMVYDLPHVVAESSSTDTDVIWIEGDMFKYMPSADAILMKWILHCWEDEECIQILTQCKKAVPKVGGKVIILDIVVDEKSKHPHTKTRLTFDLDMMLNSGGKERTEEEWKNLLVHSAGFTSYKITQISALQSVIEAYP